MCCLVFSTNFYIADNISLLMTILHTVNKSPFSSTVLQECLTVLGSGHSLLLIEDGVYGALSVNPQATIMSELCNRGQNEFFVLSDDLNARGLQNDLLLKQIKPVDYDEFVQLTIQHNSVQSWY